MCEHCNGECLGVEEILSLPELQSNALNLEQLQKISKEVDEEIKMEHLDDIHQNENLDINSDEIIEMIDYDDIKKEIRGAEIINRRDRMKNIKLKTSDGKLFELEVADYNGNELIFEIKNFKTVFSVPCEKDLEDKIERKVEKIIKKKLKEMELVETKIISEDMLQASY